MELWSNRDDAALNHDYRRFLEHDGVECDEVDIIADQMGNTVLMSIEDYNFLTRSNHALAAQARSFQDSAARWCKEAQRARRFAIGSTIIAAVALAGLLILASGVCVWL